MDLMLLKINQRYRKNIMLFLCSKHDEKFMRLFDSSTQLINYTLGFGKFRGKNERVEDKELFEI